MLIHGMTIRLHPAEQVDGVTAEAMCRRDGGDDLVRVTVCNGGSRAVPAYRFSVVAPGGRRFNKSYVGATGSEPYNWKDLGDSHGGTVWNIELDSIPAGSRAILDFALSRTTVVDEGMVQCIAAARPVPRKRSCTAWRRRAASKPNVCGRCCRRKGALT